MARIELRWERRKRKKRSCRPAGFEEWPESLRVSAGMGRVNVSKGGTSQEMETTRKGSRVKRIVCQTSRDGLLDTKIYARGRNLGPRPSVTKSQDFLRHSLFHTHNRTRTRTRKLGRN